MELVEQEQGTVSENVLPEVDLQDIFEEENVDVQENFQEAIQKKLDTNIEKEFTSEIPEGIDVNNVATTFQTEPDVQEQSVQNENIMQETIKQEQEKQKSEKKETKPHKKKKGNEKKAIGITLVAAFFVFFISSTVTGFVTNQNITKKNQILQNEIAKELNTYLSFSEEAKEYKEKFETFYLDSEDQEQLEERLQDAYDKIINQEKEKKLSQWSKNMTSFAEATEIKNKEYVQELEEKFSEYDTLLMNGEEEEKFKEKISEFQSYVEKKEYATAVKFAEESYEYGDSVTEEKYGWDVSVVQQDISSYPTIRLYLDISDGEQAVEELNKKYFILSERQGSDTEYMKQKITKATQLNQAECLNISMVADVSGSMDTNMPRVQDVMANFLENVQFEVGDQIELSSFCDDFQIEQYFTSNRESLVNQVYNLEASGGTKLYDSLIEAAQRAYLQEGARCVIAFTDGLDNCSASTETDVIAYAKQYNVPIFIIGIGVGYDYEYQASLRNIAEQTGGFYRDVEDVSESLEEVYNAIYRQQKEIYCVEYKTDASISMANTRDVCVYVKGEENGGTANYSYAPKDDYFGVLLGKFLNAYSRAVENKDYSYLEESKTLKSGGGIDQALKSYVQKDDLELAQILHYDVLNLEFKGKNTCIMTARETYDISQTKDYKKDIKKQHKNKDDVDAVQIYNILMNNGYYEEDVEDEIIDVKKVRVLKGKYKLVCTKDGSWKFKDYAASYEVESSDVYAACPEGDYNNWE